MQYGGEAFVAVRVDPIGTKTIFIDLLLSVGRTLSSRQVAMIARR